MSLACQLAVEAAERDAKGLDGTQWIVVVHREDVLRDAAELHHYVVDCNRRTPDRQKTLSIE